MFNFAAFLTSLVVGFLAVGCLIGVFVVLAHTWWPVRLAGVFTIVLCIATIVGVLGAR